MPGVGLAYIGQGPEDMSFYQEQIEKESKLRFQAKQKAKREAAAASAGEGSGADSSLPSLPKVAAAAASAPPTSRHEIPLPWRPLEGRGSAEIARFLLSSPIVPEKDGSFRFLQAPEVQPFMEYTKPASQSHVVPENRLWPRLTAFNDTNMKESKQRVDYLVDLKDPLCQPLTGTLHRRKLGDLAQFGKGAKQSGVNLAKLCH